MIVGACFFSGCQRTLYLITCFFSMDGYDNKKDSLGTSQMIEQVYPALLWQFDSI